MTTGTRVGVDSFFLVIEGLDGAGKSSIARYLFAALAPAHVNKVTLTYEPHDPSAAGAHIRDVLAKRVKVSARSLAYAFAHNRVDHLDKVINPQLNAGDKRIVICDRYLLSSLVYQSAAGLSMDDVYVLNRWARRPDLTIYLDVSPYHCYARMRNRPTDRELFEINIAERAEKYRAGIDLLRSKGEQVLTVDANASIPEVFDQVLGALKEYGPAWLRFQPPLLFD
jgi:dTMP kinase